MPAMATAPACPKNNISYRVAYDCVLVGLNLHLDVPHIEEGHFAAGAAHALHG